MLLYILLSACVGTVHLYSHGVVTSACSSMSPNHDGASAQTSSPPYTVTAVPTSFKEGDEITVTLRAVSGDFEGFMLQARRVETSIPIGTFTVTNTAEAQGLNCSEVANSAVSHKSDSEKTEIIVKWKAPTSGPLSNVEFRATFVKNKATFWEGVKSSAITYTGTSTPVTAAPTGPTSNSGCGKSKVCFSQPDNCDPTTNTACHFVSVQSSSQSEMQVQIVGPGSGYVAIGFSDDKSMGNDDIYICGKDKDGVPQVQRAFSTGRSAPNILSLGNVTDIKTSITNGVLNCSFTSRNVISTASRASGSQYYLMIASGPSSQGSIQEHTKTFVTQAKADLVNTTVIGSESTPVTAAPTGPTSNSGCGKSKVCFSQPNNCDPTTNTACHFVSVQSSSQSEMQVQIVGPGSGYVAIGFSDDQSMGNDDIYICGKDKDGVPQVQRAFSTGRSAPNILSLGNVTDIKTSITNGVLNCSFTSRNVISTASRASGSQYYLMIASGPASQGSIQQHTKTFVTQAKANLVNTTVIGSESTPVTAAPTGPTSNSGCGKSKVCFSQPDNCDPTTNTACHFVSVQSSSQSEMQVQIVGPGSGYVAIGFSDDQAMGNDDIYICGKDKDGVPQVQHAFSTGRKAPNIVSLGNISDIKTAITNGVFNCSFTSRNVISTASRAASGSQYYLMIASGPSSQGSILEHTKTFVTQDKADLLNPTVIGSEAEAYPAIVKAHGALMLIAWMTTGSVGMLIARYLKAVGKGRGCCGKDFWFLAHVTLMSLSIIATAIAFIIVFSYAQDWAGGAHPVLGCLVMILSLIQPLVAALRCDPQHEQRFIFNWAHSFNALAIKGLAVAAIFTGLALIGDTQGWMLGVMGGFVAWEALLYILQDLHMRARKKDSTICSFGMINTEVILLVVYILGNLAFLIALLVGIGRA
nr:putative ferric-chelate reductase 1 isoform X1 [Misgurnus anguillicaudatus]